MNADVYTEAARNTYITSKPFSFPSDSGSRWAVAFTSSGGTIMTAGISVAVTIAFSTLWNLLCVLAVVYKGTGSRRHYAALATIWNSNEPWFAFRHLTTHTWHSIHKGDPEKQGGGESKPNSADLWYGAIMALIALVVFCCSITLGIIVPSLIRIGSSAPVTPDSLFYPATPPFDDPIQIIRHFGLQAPSAMRSLGSVETSDDITVRRKVQFKDESPPNLIGGNRIAQFSYGYSLTGVDFGLQRAPHLRYTVEGACKTEYGWFFSDNSTAFNEVYRLWNDSNQAVAVPYSPNDIKLGPRVTFRTNVSPDGITPDGKVTYAVVVSSTRRLSVTDSSDPWYTTEARTPSEVSSAQSPAGFKPQFKVLPRRPVLSCWQKDTWTDGSITEIYPSLLKGKGLKLSDPLIDVLDAAFGSAPVIVNIGSAAGDSALLSRTTSANGVISAKDSSLIADMRRLVVASFVSSRGVFADATMYGTAIKDYKNVLKPDGVLLSGAEEFVVSDPNIQTFSLTGLVVLGAVLGALVLTVSGVMICAKVPGGSNVWARLKVLSPPQLLRCVYESEIRPVHGWPCTSLVPNLELKTGVACCKKERYCKGHFGKERDQTNEENRQLLCSGEESPAVEMTKMPSAQAREVDA